MKPESHSQAPQSAPSPVSGHLSPQALQRRSALLRGLGKGSAVIAAAVPIQTLAVPRLTERLCTVSGVQSNVGSGRTALTTATCIGFSPTHYKSTANWPNVTGSLPNTPKFAVSGKTVRKAATFASIFGGGSGNTLMDILNGVSGTNPDEKVWVAALLNGQKMPMNYPTQYTAAKVIQLYLDNTPTKGGSSTVSNDAFFFFKEYLQGA